MKNGISELSVILVSPKGALNVGGIARLMGNFGLSDLRLVDPRCDLESVECKQMAMHAMPIVRAAKRYETLKDAQADLNFSIALSGRSLQDNRPACSHFEFARSKWRAFPAGSKVGLVFGREETGLRLEELDLCNYQLWIPTVGMPSINLTSAVGIVLAELFRSELEAEQSSRAYLQVGEMPTKGQEEIFFRRISQLLWDIRFSNPQNPELTVSDLRRLFHRAQVEERDLRILFGILSQIEASVQVALKVNPHTRTRPSSQSPHTCN